MGDKWQTSVKSCGQSTIEHPELTGRQVGDKSEIMRPEHSEHPDWETSGGQMGDKWKASMKSCGQTTESIQSLLGDKWETNGRQA